MADNPGIGLQFFGDRELTDTTFTRPGTILPTFVAPIIGFHREEDLAHNDGGPQFPMGPDVRIPTLPVRSHQATDRSGILIQGFYDLFWKDRLHILPARIDFGSILSAQEGAFQIYNSGTKLGQHVRRVTALNDLTSLGVSITSGNTTVPVTLGLGQSEGYTYLVSTVGPAVFDDSYDFTFNTGVLLQHFLSGERILLLTFCPQDPFKERWSFVTDILEKVDGSEQRIATRRIPRQEIDHEYLFTDPLQLIKLENTLTGRIPNQIALPYWKDYVTLTASVNIGDTVLPVTSTTDRDFRAGQPVAIFDSVTEQFEVKEVLTFSGSSITLTDGLISAWASGLEVLPVMFTYVKTPYRQSRWPKDIASLPLTFQVVSNKDFSDASAYPTYLGVSVYTDPLLLEDVQFQQVYDYGTNSFDSVSGLFYEQSLKVQPSMGLSSFIAIFENRTEYKNFRNFIHSRHGRHVAFWVTSQQSDFLPDNVNPGTPSQVDSVITGYESVFARGIRTSIEIKYLDGTIDRREVTNVINSGTYEQLVLSSALSQEWSPTNVVRCSHLYLVRFDVDSFEFVHDWPSNGLVRFTLKEVQA